MNFLLIYHVDVNLPDLENAAYFPIGGVEAALMLYRRLKKVKLISDIIISTSSKTPDKKLYELFKNDNIEISKTIATNNLERITRIAFEHQADYVVLVTNDNPLIDIEIIDTLIEFCIESKEEYDYAGNMHPESYPAGNKVEIIRTASLSYGLRYSKFDYERKYITPFFWDEPDQWNIGNMSIKNDISKKYRYCMEYPEDLKVINLIYEELFKASDNVSYTEIVDFLRKNPEINKINERYKGTHWYREHFSKLKTISGKDTRLMF